MRSLRIKMTLASEYIFLSPVSCAPVFSETRFSGVPGTWARSRVGMRLPPRGAPAVPACRALKQPGVGGRGGAEGRGALSHRGLSLCILSFAHELWSLLCPRPPPPPRRRLCQVAAPRVVSPCCSWRVGVGPVASQQGLPTCVLPGPLTTRPAGCPVRAGQAERSCGRGKRGAREWEVLVPPNQ